MTSAGETAAAVNSGGWVGRLALRRLLSSTHPASALAQASFRVRLCLQTSPNAGTTLPLGRFMAWAGPPPPAACCLCTSTVRLRLRGEGKLVAGRSTGGPALLAEAGLQAAGQAPCKPWRPTQPAAPRTRSQPRARAVAGGAQPPAPASAGGDRQVGPAAAGPAGAAMPPGSRPGAARCPLAPPAPLLALHVAGPPARLPAPPSAPLPASHLLAGTRGGRAWRTATCPACAGTCCAATSSSQC